MDGIQSLVYAKLDPTQEETLTKDDTIVDDVGIIKEFRTLWHIELEGDDDDGEGRHVCQCVYHVEEMGAVVGDAIVGEGEERMIEVAKEFILEERVVSPTKEGLAPGRDDDDRGDILAILIPSIDTLLGDIYEFKYHLLQANSHMY